MFPLLAKELVSLITLLGFVGKKAGKGDAASPAAEHPVWICSFSSNSSQPRNRKAAWGETRRAGHYEKRCRDEELLSFPMDERKTSTMSEQGLEARTGPRPCTGRTGGKWL